MKKSLSFLSLYLLFFQLGFPVSNCQSQDVDKNQKALHHEVTVTLKLIQVYVRDKKGNPVSDLSQSDFELYDNGKLQPITDFEKHFLSLPVKTTEEKELPPSPEVPSRLNRKFFLLFDFAFSDQAGIIRSKEAALHFIDTDLSPTDEIGVMSYSVNKGLTLHEYLTTDHKKARQVIEGFGARKTLGRAEDVEGRYWQELGKMAEAMDKTGKFGGGFAQAAAHDQRTYRVQASNFTVELADLARALRYVPGFKQIVLFSGGIANFVLYGSTPTGVLYFGEPDQPPAESGWGDAALRRQYENMSKELATSNIPVYAINTAGKESAHFKNRDLVGDYSLKEIAARSGGSYFDNIVSYETILENIQKRTSSYYVLGYSIDDKWDGQYHKIKVSVKRKGCEANAQGGYFNPKPFSEWTEDEKMLQLLDLALSENPHFQEPINFPMTVLPYSLKEKSYLALLAQVDREKIKEIIWNKAEVVMLIFDKGLNLVELERHETSVPIILQEDLFYYSILLLAPEKYNCRLVIRNLETGKGAVASSEALIPETQASGLRIYSPLLLVPGKNAKYLKNEKNPISLFTIFPFDPGHYSPLVSELSQGVSRLEAVVRCSAFGIQSSEIQLSAQIINLELGEKTPLPLSVLSQSQIQENILFLAELEVGELRPGKYALYFFAQHGNNLPKPWVVTNLTVK